MKHFKHEELRYNVVVCGGGLAGVCAAIAAARGGARVGLLHDRTVLGGNSSSEVRVTPHGAAQFHAYARETGIISELLIEERARNHAQIMENGWTNSVWDLVLLSAVLAEPKIELHLNTKVLGAEVEGHQIVAVRALVLDSETEVTARASVFVDSTGDGLVAHSAGCETMFGTEGRDRWDEPHATERGSTDTMGNSLHFKTEDVGGAVAFEPPPWAKDLSDRSFFYDQGRVPGDPRGGYWWIELGAPRHTIYDNREIRSELQKYVLGIWDWMKNKDPDLRDATATRALDWMGSVLGTRESRRVIGRTVVTEHDIQARRAWLDEVAHGGWFLDLHTPGGLIAEHSEANSATNYNPFTERAALGYVGPYGIPLSALIARDVTNLFLAGRDISASHAALGTMRVMATTALMGQAVGTAAAACLRAELVPGDLGGDGTEPGSLPAPAVGAIQRIRRRLCREGVWLPGGPEADPDDLAQRATVTASSEDVVRGIHPDTLGYAEEHEMIDLRFKEEFLSRTETRMAQPIATDGSLREVQLFLSNHASTDTTVHLALFGCNGIHDYTVYAPERAIATGTVDIEAGYTGWVVWKLPDSVAALAPSLQAGSYVRLELAKSPNLQWHQARTCLPGHPAIYEVALGRMRRLQHGISLGFRAVPAQPVFSASNVLSGTTRPNDRTHLWRSDPAEPLPAWIDLTWPEPVIVRSVELTFAGNLLREYHAYRPYFRDPQTARDYSICAETDDGWTNLVTATGNYQRRRVHTLEEPSTTTRLRLRVDATNGERTAAIYEIRVY